MGADRRYGARVWSGVGFAPVKPYEAYNDFKFNIPVGKNGDCYDRYLVRVEECRESVRIMKQCIENMPDGPVSSADGKVVPPKRAEMKQSMEA